MPKPSQSDLLILKMRVVWRDTFIIEPPPSDFLNLARKRLVGLPVYRADRYTPRHSQPDLLRVAERAARNVARIGYEDLLRFQFADFQIANLNPTLSRLRRSPDKVAPEELADAGRIAEERQNWIGVTPMLLLHRAGVGIMEYVATFDATRGGYPVDKAIELVRMGISPEMLLVGDAWRGLIPDDYPLDGFYARRQIGPDSHLVIGGLRDLSELIAGKLNAPDRRLGKRHAASQTDLRRPTGSTTVTLVETKPSAGMDFPTFVGKHAAELRGIGALDNYYRERAAWIVERELTNNLSADTEMALYLLGNSELILFNDHLPPLIPATRDRIGLPSDDLAVAYLYMHYHALIEWVYLQDAILRAYIQRLDSLAASPRPRRRQMIGTLQGALADLVQYQESITAYATRIEFLERAGRYHQLDQLAARFKDKQELLLAYASEYHDYREARATEFLNWLAGILTGAALANLVVTLGGIGPEQAGLYLGIHIASIVVVLAVLWVVQRLL